jgi:hypothetical protein
MKNQLLLKTAGTMLVRILFAVVAAFPIVFMLVSSLKPDQQIFGDMSSLAAFLPVGNISLDNYTAVFDRVPAARFLLNSAGVSAVTVILGIFVNSLCAFPDPGTPPRVVGQPAPLLRTQRFQPRILERLAGHLPGPDHSVHRQCLLHLPVPPVL